MTSKAARIRDLYAKGTLTTGQIAKAVGCRPEYVRVVARQRTRQGGVSNADIAYRVTKHGSLKGYYDAQNARTKPYRCAYYAKRWREDPEYRRQSYACKARARARKRLEAHS